MNKDEWGYTFKGIKELQKLKKDDLINLHYAEVEKLHRKIVTKERLIDFNNKEIAFLKQEHILKSQIEAASRYRMFQAKDKQSLMESTIETQYNLIQSLKDTLKLVVEGHVQKYLPIFELINRVEEKPLKTSFLEKVIKYFK